MTELVFTDGTLAGYFLSGVVYFLLPVAAFFLMKRIGAASIWQVLFGAAFYFLSVPVLYSLTYCANCGECL